MSRVVMFVRNDATRDSRVLREAETLSAAGHVVSIVAIQPAAGGLPAVEQADGFDIIRVPAPGTWRLVWAWVRYPWRIRGRAVAAIKRALDHGPPGWPLALLIVVALVVSVPWILVRGTIHLLRGRPSSRRTGLLDWLLSWRFGMFGWARDAGRAAPVADVYHGHDLPGLAAAVAAANRLGGLVVYDSHEIFLESGTYADLPRWVNRLIARQERRLAGRATALVTVNPAIGAELQRRLPVRQLVIVHNCPPVWTPPDPPRDLLRTAASIPSDAPVLLYHGVFTNHRGLEQLAEASLEPGLERAHVVYLGYGGSRHVVDRLAADPRFGGRLHVLDAVEPTVLLDWVAGADVGVIPGQPSTLNHWLSSPNKLFEALAAGVPVAIMDFPYVHELVLEDPAGPLGTVCDPAEPASIARAIREIIEQPEEARRALRARCLQAAHERWNWETESARLVELYARLAEVAGATIGSASNRGTGTSQST
jgi:glycosyltransferase involved in cell wall biosynthesis